MIIKNGIVFCEDNQFHKKNIRIKDDLIVEITDNNILDDDDIYDASNNYVIPGLVDIHSHGAVSHDCSDANLSGLLEILAYEKSHGVTSYCPTTMTLSKEDILKALSTINEAKNYTDKKYARILGINMEGPFLDINKKGAHDEKYIINPDNDFFNEALEACSHSIRLVTLAPNLTGSFDFITSFKEKVHISLGHSASDYITAKKAFDTGADHVTHLYNAMSPLSHRDPGLIGASFDSSNAVVELICDGIHIDESVIRMTFELFKNRVALISDSMRATGLADGQYDLGGQDVFVSGKKATLKDGTIAGSVSCLFDCMRKAISIGIPVEAAIASATSIPAKSIGLKNVGTISVGAYADLLILDKSYELMTVI